MLLLILFALLLPLSAFAGDSSPQHRGTVVIPNGQGGVTYWQGQGGTDAYTAGQIGQGLTQEFQRARQAQTPRYTPPPLEVPPSLQPSSRPSYPSDSDIGHQACVTLGRC